MRRGSRGPRWKMEVDEFKRSPRGKSEVVSCVKDKPAGRESNPYMWMVYPNNVLLAFHFLQMFGDARELLAG